MYRDREICNTIVNCYNYNCYIVVYLFLRRSESNLNRPMGGCILINLDFLIRPIVLLDFCRNWKLKASLRWNKYHWRFNSFCFVTMHKMGFCLKLLTDLKPNKTLLSFGKVKDSINFPLENALLKFLNLSQGTNANCLHHSG